MPRPKPANPAQSAISHGSSTISEDEHQGDDRDHERHDRDERDEVEVHGDLLPVVTP